MGTLQTRYIEQLKAETNRQREEGAKVKDPPVDPRLTDSWKPLSAQITNLWLNLPADLRPRPVLISELIPLLVGKYKPRPSAGDVGQALRSLNFTSVRDWRSGRRRWLPSQDIL